MGHIHIDNCTEFRIFSYTVFKVTAVTAHMYMYFASTAYLILILPEMTKIVHDKTSENCKNFDLLKPKSGNKGQIVISVKTKSTNKTARR